MAEGQLSCGFAESLLQIDEHTLVRIHNRREPELELIASGRKLSLSKRQWETLQYLGSNIQLAFTLLTQGKITTVNEGKRHVDVFDEIVADLGI